MPYTQRLHFTTSSEDDPSGTGKPSLFQTILPSEAPMVKSFSIYKVVVPTGHMYTVDSTNKYLLLRDSIGTNRLVTLTEGHYTVGLGAANDFCTMLAAILTAIDALARAAGSPPPECRRPPGRELPDVLASHRRACRVAPVRSVQPAGQ